jgi:two-component system NtrC family response regulator
MCETPVLEKHELGFIDNSLERGGEELEIITLREARNRLESDMVISAIRKYTGNVAKAAEALGISRPTIYDLMKKHGFHHSPPDELLHVD